MALMLAHSGMPSPPQPGTFYLQFQRQLAASEQIVYLAQVLAHAHWLYEGWGDVAVPLNGELKRIYERAACGMVRACSEVERKVATSRAERWGLNAFDALMENVQMVDAERGEQLIRSFIKQCLDVQRFALMHGVGEMAPQEQALMAEANGDL